MWLLSLSIFLSSFCFGQGKGWVSAQMDAKEATIGDQVRLFLLADFNPATGKLVWPIIPDSFGSLEVVEKGKIDTNISNGKTTLKQRILLSAFDSGTYKIPSLQFAVTPNSGDAYILTTDSLYLHVNTVAVDTTKEFKPIKGNIKVTTNWRDYIWYIAGGSLLLVLAIIATIIYMKRKPAKPVAKPAPSIPLQDRMLTLLNELEQKQLWQKGNVKEYYIELTDIVRGYIEERFRTPALELTTDELLSKIAFNKELLPFRELLSNILTTADYAKFAKHQPMPQEHFDAMENAKKFIDTTRPKPVITEQTTEQKI